MARIKTDGRIAFKNQLTRPAAILSYSFHRDTSFFQTLIESLLLTGADAEQLTAL